MTSRWPARFVWFSCALVALWAIAFCQGCALRESLDPSTVQGQRAIVSAVGVAANATTPLVAMAEERAALDIIDQTDTLDEVQPLLALNRERWDRVWTAIDAIVAAQNAAANELDAGHQVDLAPLRAAWCSLREGIAAKVAMPDFPGLSCEVTQ